MVESRRDSTETKALLEFKEKVKKAFEEREDRSLKLSYFYNILAREHGFKNYNVYRAYLLRKVDTK